MATRTSPSAEKTAASAVTDSDGAVAFESLPGADLVVDRVYRGGLSGTVADDPLQRLLPVGNQGGFRYQGSPSKRTVRLCVLYTSGRETDWPDRLDPTTGDFTYFGDNRRPGRQLLQTTRRGNELLQHAFALSHGDAGHRREVPPFLLFEKVGARRDVRFRGLLAPGSPRLSPEEELVAVWRTTENQRFQNYRSHFTVLATDTVSREWIDAVLDGDVLSVSCPPEWRLWVQSRDYRPLLAPRTLSVRRRQDQLPSESLQIEILDVIYQHFAPDPHAFEGFAADVWLISDPKVTSVDVTRPSRDGGRDAVGLYLIGPSSDPISIDFALEAKCYQRNSSVGVREISRLISRLRARQFGVLVTTSYLNQQAYSEIREDQHPVVVISGKDIVEILSAVGHRTPGEVKSYLAINHPVRRQEAVDLSYPVVDASVSP